MKLKVYKSEVKEIETDLDLPIYLYFQDEFCYDELVKVTEKGKITIKYEPNSLSISSERGIKIVDYYINKRNLTTEKHFNEAYEEALNYIQNTLK